MPELDAAVRTAISDLFGELTEGAPKGGPAWVLNGGDPGLLGSLDRLSAAAASARPPNGGASVAAHVRHILYGVGLSNRWSQGENPYADADWSRSWREQSVTDQQWDDLRAELRDQLGRWREAVMRPRELNQIEVTGIIASAAHLAYHFGAIRQIDRSIRGPSAID